MLELDWVHIIKLDHKIHCPLWNNKQSSACFKKIGLKYCVYGVCAYTVRSVKFTHHSFRLIYQLNSLHATGTFMCTRNAPMLHDGHIYVPADLVHFTALCKGRDFPRVHPGHLGGTYVNATCIEQLQLLSKALYAVVNSNQIAIKVLTILVGVCMCAMAVYRL